MEAFSVHRGKAAPLMIDNIDTDMIIPKDFLKTIKRSGLGAHLFEELRRHPDGRERQDFIFSQPQYQGMSILLSGKNFGCGSSREHAPWALCDYGIRVIIAVSFADIFASNSAKNGLLLISLAADKVQRLVTLAEAGSVFTVDLPRQLVQVDEDNSFPFVIDHDVKEMLLAGLDEISRTMQSADQIGTFESQQQQRAPWLSI